MRADGFSAPILAYHALGPETSPIAADPSRFADTLDAFIASGRRSIAIDALFNDNMTLDTQAFVLTFDDCDESLEVAAEILSARGLQATAFVVTRRTGRMSDWRGGPRWDRPRRLLSWNAIRALEPMGIRFGSHTQTHPRLDALASDAIEREIRGAREDLADHVANPSRVFAHPYGASNRRVRACAARHHSGACGTEPGLASPQRDRMNLPRIDAYYLRSRSNLEKLLRNDTSWLDRRRILRAAARFFRERLRTERPRTDCEAIV